MTGDRRTAHPSGRPLEGNVAIITGASRGIGATTASVFAERGAAVVLAARDEQALRAIAKEIEARDGRALVVPTDVGDPASVERLVARTTDEYGRLDAAVNNAGGGYPPVPLADLDPTEFDRVLGVNLRGVFLSMKYEIPAMLASGGGAIVNMSSTVGVRGWQGIGAYVAAKHGVVGLTRSGALAGLRDPLLAPAMRALHTAPERKWTVADLAMEAAVSRSFLDNRFRNVLGLSPIRYLNEWRMRVAQDLLATTEVTVAAIARRVGYDSEEAFSRAFKRAHGQSP